MKDCKQKAFFGLLLVACLMATAAHGLKHHLEIKNDRRGSFFIENFGFEADGRLKINMTNIEAESGGDASEHRLGLVIKRTMTDYQRFLQDNEDVPCILDEHLEAFEQRIRINDFEKTEYSLNIRGDATAFYNIYFISCDAPGDAISFTLDMTMSNPGPNYLSSGDSPLPTVYAFYFLAYLGALTLWVWTYLLPNENKKVYLIHHLMTLCLLLKLGALFFHSLELHYLKIMGHPGKWTWVYLVFSLMKGVMFFLVVGLIGSGWAFIRPFLSDRDRTLFIVVIPLQIISNFALVILEETTPGSATWFTWHDIFRLVDVICCIAILVPIVKSINHLKAASLTDGKAAVNMEKLKLFREYYMLLVAYIYFTRVIVFLLNGILLFRWTWMSVCVAELCTLCFIVATGYYFRPVEDNPYFKMERDADMPMALEEGKGELSDFME